MRLYLFLQLTQIVFYFIFRYIRKKCIITSRNLHNVNTITSCAPTSLVFYSIIAMHDYQIVILKRFLFRGLLLTFLLYSVVEY